MNVANFFTATRILLAPFFVFLYFLPVYYGISEKLILAIIIPLFAYMEFTDFLDGYAARKYNHVSNFGKLFDPFADVVANITMLLLFMIRGYVPLVFFIIILYREMGILFLRMIASGDGITIGAKKGGKTKTVCYIVAESFSLVIDTARAFFSPSEYLVSSFICVNKVVYGIAVILAVLSFADYFFSYRKLRTRKNTDKQS